jgi:hypothetical protein
VACLLAVWFRGPTEASAWSLFSAVSAAQWRSVHAAVDEAATHCHLPQIVLTKGFMPASLIAIRSAARSSLLRSLLAVASARDA